MSVYCDPDSRYCFAISLDDMTVESAVAMQERQKSVSLPHDAPLGDGPPTREELLAHYPAKFTWTHMKTFVNSGCVPNGGHSCTSELISFFRLSDLGLLKRDKKLQIRYDAWAEGIRAQYGSIGEILQLSCAAYLVSKTIL